MENFSCGFLCVTILNTYQTQALTFVRSCLSSAELFIEDWVDLLKDGLPDGVCLRELTLGLRILATSISCMNLTLMGEDEIEEDVDEAVSEEAIVDAVTLADGPPDQDLVPLKGKERAASVEETPQGDIPKILEITSEDHAQNKGKAHVDSPVGVMPKPAPPPVSLAVQVLVANDPEVLRVFYCSVLLLLIASV